MWHACCPCQYNPVMVWYLEWGPPSCLSYFSKVLYEPSVRNFDGDPNVAKIPSNTTWQWNITHLQNMFPFKTFICRDVPACHVSLPEGMFFNLQPGTGAARSAELWQNCGKWQRRSRVFFGVDLMAVCTGLTLEIGGLNMEHGTWIQPMVTFCNQQKNDLVGKHMLIWPKMIEYMDHGNLIGYTDKINLSENGVYLNLWPF